MKTERENRQEESELYSMVMRWVACEVAIMQAEHEHRGQFWAAVDRMPPEAQSYIRTRFKNDGAETGT